LVASILFKIHKFTNTLSGHFGLGTFIRKEVIISSSFYHIEVVLLQGLCHACDSAYSFFHPGSLFCYPELLISNIDINSIDNTFGVSISVSTIFLGRVSKVVSTILLRPFFCRYFDIDTFELMIIKFQRIS